ncbi:MAG: efflux RND transporter periplasmic adaptor subunit [Rhodobacteraceae bacterium]|nr:efflux RND transporter periplasmic adaptor subunit [Paracoccaceae bacterium]
MKMLAKYLVRFLSLTVPLALGLMSIMAFAGMKSPPSAKEVSPKITPVRVITIAPTPIVPRVSGYGSVSPAREWRAVARIEGDIVWTSDKLANGLLADAGAELMRIDQSGIKLVLAQIDAQIGSIKVKDETVRASLAISEAEWDISRTDLVRQRELAERGTVTQTTLDKAVRQELSSRSNVNSLKNQLALNEAERNVLVTQRNIALRDLGFTSIKTPYAVRIGQVSAETGQFVSRGQVLVATEGLEAVEIAAQIPIGRMSRLMRGATQSLSAGPVGLEAKVLLRAPTRTVEWTARVARVGDQIDPRTQSINVVVVVDKPMEQAKAGKKPPLRRNMFVEVELRAPERTAIVIPRDAVHGGFVFVVNNDGKLEKRKVQIAYAIETVAIVAKGLSKGDRIVVTDMDIAVPGKKVKPLEDKALKTRLALVALGSDDAK